MKKVVLLCLYCGLALLLVCLSACTLIFPPVSPARSTPFAPTSTPTAAFNAEYFDQAFWSYFHYVGKRQLSLAYGMLSPGLHSREPFADFLKNDNYTLTKDGSWTVDKIAVSRQDGAAWNVGVELIFYAASSSRWISYYWNIHFQIIDGRAMIVAIGLYPTGTGRRKSETGGAGEG